MAGDWIKMRVDLATSPKVVRMASALKADRLRVIGGLHAVWCLFDVHSADGRLDGYTLDALDDLIGFPGFGQAMASVGWLEDEGDSLCTPRFDEHNGQSAKRRAMETERKREARKVSASDADKMRSREEKRREDISTPDGVDTPPRKRAAPAAPKPMATVDTLVAAGFPPEIAAEFIAHKASVKAPLTERAWRDHLAEAQKAGWTPLQAAEKVMAKEWKGFEAKYVAHEPIPTAAPATTYAQQDELARRRRWEEMTGRKWPEPGQAQGQVIDVTPAGPAAIGSAA